MLVAPHTSGWDFIYGSGARAWLGFGGKFLIKREFFKFPFKRMFIKMGGVPVDRTQNNSMVDAMIQYIKSNDRAIIVFPPEGTRKRVTKWKTGFYYAALGADVPIVMAYLDYAEKKAGVGPSFVPSGDIQKDFIIIRDFYKNITPKIPEDFALPE
ncbi:MAG: 1-acyl-sn-glycerol-3-phosphate acyltransferase [Chitinophagales bacterium]|nr:1-acyl-sn-glycerol-3-phosphate acyltransferase [Chitinophagales bacterium]